MGCRRQLGPMGTGRRPAARRGHRRSGHLAGQGRLVPGHQPARPGGPHEADSPHPAASLAEVLRIYGLRNWVEQSYKQVKDELGWADFQVRSDLAIRRHQALVNCAFSFCWDAWFADHPAPSQPAAPQPGPGCGERGQPPHRRRHPGRGRCARSAPGSPPGSRCGAGGPPSPKRPPPPLQALISSVAAGYGLHLYIPN